MFGVACSEIEGKRRLISKFHLTHFFLSRTLITVILWFTMGMTVKLFTLVYLLIHLFDINSVYSRIHHPFLLSDNRHYTFYVWRRVYMVHPMMPYALVPAYLACAWAWWLRVGKCQPYKGRNEPELIRRRTRSNFAPKLAFTLVCGSNLATNPLA